MEQDPPLHRRHRPAQRLPPGIVAGVTSTLAHLGGPPVTAYLITTDLEPRPLIATTAALFTVVTCSSSPPICSPVYLTVG
ncbi:MAG: hypothetical protein U9N84_04265 [Actinomycetota bacterium]|nr:hypothetical protein [Actinomycetota bacterium]